MWSIQDDDDKDNHLNDDSSDRKLCLMKIKKKDEKTLKEWSKYQRYFIPWPTDLNKKESKTFISCFWTESDFYSENKNSAKSQIYHDDDNFILTLGC